MDGKERGILKSLKGLLKRRERLPDDYKWRDLGKPGSTNREAKVQPSPMTLSQAEQKFLSPKALSELMETFPQLTQSDVEGLADVMREFMTGSKIFDHVGLIMYARARDLAKNKENFRS